jgi:HAD superfamily hydrolase (TIGR01509 family)
MPKTTKPPFAVVFDMDGVLINTEPVHEQVNITVAKHFGLSPDVMNSISRPGRSMRDFYLELQKLHPFDADFETYSEKTLETMFIELEKTINGPDPQLIAFLHHLREQGIPVAVGTAALKRSAARKLGVVKLHNEFDVIVTADDVERHKPHPDVYLETAKRLGIKPAKCIVIEDAGSGIQAAHAAGMKVIGYGKYVNDPATLKHADLVVSEFSKLNYSTLLQLVTV